MRTQRHMVQLRPAAYDALCKFQEAILKSEGKRISITDGVEIALVSLLSPAMKERERADLVSVIAQIVKALAPDARPLVGFRPATDEIHIKMRAPGRPDIWIQRGAGQVTIESVELATTPRGQPPKGSIAEDRVKN